MEVNKSQRNYAITAGVAGGLGGAVYGLRHPSSKAVDKLAQLTPTTVETMQGYRDSFDISAAKKAVAEGKLDLKTFNTVKNITDVFDEIVQKEQAVVDIQKTPYAQRTKTLKQAIKEANAMRPKMYKSMFAFGRIQDKLIETGVFDAEKMKQINKLTKQKMFKMYKYLAGSITKGLAIGAAVGALVGLGIHSIVKK